jgi:tetratricopeptide (TPR) repeat protein
MRRIVLLLSIAIMGGCLMSTPKKETEPLPDFDALWDYRDPQGTAVKFREIEPIAKKSGDLSYYTQLLTQIARTEGMQRNFDAAAAILDSVESMLTDDLAVARIRYLLERGRVYNSSSKPEDAIPHFLEAWDLARAQGEDYYAVDAAHMLAIAHPPERQLEWAEKAMEVAERTSDERAKKWLGPLYNNTGWTYHDLGQYEKALRLFEKSLTWREERQDEEGARIARWTIARTYRSLNRIEEALALQRELQAEREEKGLDPSGYVFEELAECLLLLEQEDEARPYFRQAYEILSKDEWLVENESERLNRLKALGE